MRWSLEELLYGLKVATEDGWFWRRLVRLPKTIWRQIKVLFHWIFTGYCWATIWELDSYLMKVILQRLKQFKKMDRMGYAPIDSVRSEEDWEKVLDRLILGFEIMIDTRIADNHPELHGSLKEKEVTVGGKTIMATVWENDSPKEVIDLMLKAQLEQSTYDEETMLLFAKHFRALWD
jgi:hypothetical protein